MTKFKRIRTEKILQRCIKSHLLLLCLIYSMFRKLYETGKGSLDFRHVAVFVFPPINYSVDVLLYKIWRDIKIDVATMMRGVATNIWWLIGLINVAYYRFVLLMHLIISGNGYWRVNLDYIVFVHNQYTCTCINTKKYYDSTLTL